MESSPLHRAYLSLGSNIEPEQNLPDAVRELANHCRVVAVSHVWESAPFDGSEQSNYLNAAILIETPLEAAEFHRQVIVAVETALGRVRHPGYKNAPRTIDIDLSLFDQETLSLDHRQIPDPDIPKRPFVAVPLAELDPEYLHPALGRPLREIAGETRLKAPALTLREDVKLSGP